jgi:hypothetical protein
MSAKREIVFPNQFVSPTIKKDKEYGLKMFKAMYFSDMTNKYFNYSERKRRFIDNRRYAEGLQLVDKYKDLMDMNGDTSYLNIDWTPPPVASKFVDLLAGEIINQAFKIQCNAIDQNSRIEKDKERSEIYANLLLKDFSEESEKMTGIPAVRFDKPIPEDKEEADLYMQLNFKQATEIAMEAAIEYVMYANKWDSDLKEKIIRDLINLKIAGIRVKYDSNMDIRWRWIDPVKLITPYTSRDDFSDNDYAGEEISMTISEIRRESDLSEEELFKVASEYAGKNGNGKLSQDNYLTYYHQSDSSGNFEYEYNDFLISVLDGEFRSLNIKNYLEKENGKGGFYFDEKSFDYKQPKKKKGQKLHSYNQQDVYEGMWIIGTDSIFNYKKRKNIPRKKKEGKYLPTADLSFIIIAPQIFEMQNKSMLERIKPFADQMALTFYKIQALIAKARPKGISVDVSALEDLAFGEGNEMGPLEIQEIYDQTGVFYYRGIDEEGEMKNQKPIQELENGIGNDLSALIGIYNHNLQMVRDVTGLNEARDASTPDKDMLVGLQELALAASNNATRPLNKAYYSLVERAASYTSLMIQDTMEHKGEMEGLYAPLGENNVKTLEVGKDLALIECGIKIQALPTQVELNDLKNKVNIAIQAGMLSIEDAFEIEDIAKNSVKLAIQVYKQRKRQNAEEQQQAAAANSEQTAAVQQASAEAKAKGDAMKEAEKSKGKMSEMQLEYELKNDFEDKQLSRDLQRISAEGVQKIMQIDKQDEGNDNGDSEGAPNSTDNQ